jgi:hypothetical protein
VKKNLLVAGLAPLLLLATVEFDPPRSLSQLLWMAGCWELRDGDTLIEEQWMKPAAQVMLGMSRTTTGGRTRGFEHLLIREDSSETVYRAMPSGQEPAEFRAVELTDSTAIFSDPTHDFPQRIHYRRGAAGDSLWARTEGEIGGVERVVHFRYGRVSCPAPVPVPSI